MDKPLIYRSLKGLNSKGVGWFLGGRTEGAHNVVMVKKDCGKRVSGTNSLDI